MSAALSILQHKFVEVFGAREQSLSQAALHRECHIRCAADADEHSATLDSLRETIEKLGGVVPTLPVQVMAQDAAVQNGVAQEDHDAKEGQTETVEGTLEAAQ